MSDGGRAMRDLAFVSYSHADKVWLERFRILFKPYVRKGRLEVWADPHLQVGERWERSIDEALARARVGVLLLSPNFAASDFIAEAELPALRAAAEQGLLTLFCIPVSSVDDEILDLDGYQWARPPHQPLDLLSEAERNRALVEITKTLVAMFNVAREDAWPGDRASAAQRTGEELAVERLGKAHGVVLATLHGVPESPPHFVPRTSALNELKQALLEGTSQRHGISAAVRAGLHGQGGIGKTVLAAALCRDDDVRRTFADGVYWLTFGQEPDLIALQQLLLEVATGKRVELESTNLGAVALRDELRDRNCLLVLDDVWQGAHAAAFEVLGPRGRLLVTTRDQEILNALGARTLSLDVLSPDDALGLLASWAKKSRESLPLEAAEVARECGYLPLALALAGAQAGTGTSWADLAKALHAGNLEFLDHAHLSVFKSLSLSVRALSPDHAARYCELAVFPEDLAVPESAIVRLWGEAELSAPEARKLLVHFSSKALLFLTGSEPTREVRFHDLHGDYLRLVVRDLPTAHARLLDAHTRILPSTESGPTRWAFLPADETYLWGHLLHHLIGAGRREEADAVVSDKRWLAARIAATGVSSLLVDLALLVERAPSATSVPIERALRLEAGWLHDHPEALEGLLYNRLRGEGLSAKEIEGLVPDLRPRVRLSHPVNFGGGRVFRGHSDPVNACAYAPGGQRIVSSSTDKTLREWDRESGKELQRFEGHVAGVTACAYSPDGQRIISASEDKTLRDGIDSQVWSCAASKGTRMR